MRKIVWFGLLVLLGADAFAQRGGFGGGMHGGGAHGSFGPGGSRPGTFRSRGARGFDGRFGSPFTGDFYPFPLFDDWYDYGYPYEGAQQQYMPNTVVIQPVQPMIVQQTPPPVGSVIHTYDAGTQASPTGEQPTFVIALNNGSRLEATAVWVQDGVVHYIDTDDRSHQIPLTSVDRNLTRKLNQDRNLNLRLPPP